MGQFINDNGFRNIHRYSLFMFHETVPAIPAYTAVVLLRGMELTLGAVCKHAHVRVSRPRGAISLPLS